MGWTPSTRLEISATGGLLVVHAHADGVIFLTKRGHLRLPTPYRRCYGLVPGDRVLLVADPAQGRLVVHPSAARKVIAPGQTHGVRL
jgi:bifunctional DNA-binding transcriptional regulator/antitoxin component of YhaV-PrlF toxin-antitoxin module